MADYRRDYGEDPQFDKGTVRITVAKDFEDSGAQKTVPERSRVLAEADDLVNGDRLEEYGTPQVNFRRIAGMWDILIPRPGKPWTESDVSLALLGLKLARAVQGFKRDTFVDIAGYAALAAELGGTEGVS